MGALNLCERAVGGMPTSVGSHYRLQLAAALAAMTHEKLTEALAAGAARRLLPENRTRLPDAESSLGLKG